MKSKEVRDLSITVTAFYMKIAGFWTSTNYVEERRRNVTMSYTLFAILFATTTEVRDLYFSWGNFSVSHKTFPFKVHSKPVEKANKNQTQIKEENLCYNSLYIIAKDCR